MSEKEFVDALEKKFIVGGWQTKREVIPTTCLHWNKPLRVDLIVWKEGIGPIGIEAKEISLRQGGVVAKAVRQVLRYSEHVFLNKSLIKKWAIALNYTHPCANNHDVDVFVLSFLNNFGIGYVYNDKIDFSYENGCAKIPIVGINPILDINFINTLVSDRWEQRLCGRRDYDKL